MFLKCLLYEPTHKGNNLALLSLKDAVKLCIHETLLENVVICKIYNPDKDKTAYARLFVSNDLNEGHIGLEAHIASNCDVFQGDEIELAVISDISKFENAQTIELGVTSEMRLSEKQKFELAEQVKNCRLLVHPSANLVFCLDEFDVDVKILSLTPANFPLWCSDDTIVIFDMNKSNEIDKGVEFDGVGGLHETIKRIKELVVLPIMYPDLFKKAGITPIKGILLHGPAGSGKTLIARSIAQKVKANFYLINGPEILSKWYGESERQLRELFYEAAKNAPSIIFIDELDSIAPVRDNVSGDLEVRIVSQLLTLMDGIENRGKVIIIGATNRIHAIDPALRRPGRFDCEIEIYPPNLTERYEILKVHTRKLSLSPEIDLEKIAEKTAGYVGADLSMVCQEAALSMIRRNINFTDNELLITNDNDFVVTDDDFNVALRSVQPSTFRMMDKVNVVKDWDELIGCQDTKRSLLELIGWPISHPSLLKSYGVTTRRNILLRGRRLSGKTSLVVALAKKININLIYMQPDDLLAKNLYDADRTIHSIFKRGRVLQPSIVFFDSFEQILSGGLSPDLAIHILRKVQNELVQTEMNSFVAVIVALQTDLDKDERFKWLYSYFSDQLVINQPTREDLNHLIQSRFPTFAESNVEVSKIVEAILEHGFSIGEANKLLEDIVLFALHENGNGDVEVIRNSHIQFILDRLEERG